MVPTYKLSHRNIKLEAKAAVAWGVADKESTGYTQIALVRLIAKLVERIEVLEATLREHNIRFQETELK